MERREFSRVSEQLLNRDGWKADIDIRENWIVAAGRAKTHVKDEYEGHIRTGARRKFLLRDSHRIHSAINKKNVCKCLHLKAKELLMIWIIFSLLSLSLIHLLSASFCTFRRIMGILTLNLRGSIAKGCHNLSVINAGPQTQPLPSTHREHMFGSGSSCINTGSVAKSLH